MMFAVQNHKALSGAWLEKGASVRYPDVVPILTLMCDSCLFNTLGLHRFSFVSFPACIVTLPLLGYSAFESNKTDSSTSSFTLRLWANTGIFASCIVLATTIHDGPDSQTASGFIQTYMNDRIIPSSWPSQSMQPGYAFSVLSMQQNHKASLKLYKETNTGMSSCPEYQLHVRTYSDIETRVFSTQMKGIEGL